MQNCDSLQYDFSVIFTFLFQIIRGEGAKP